MHKVDYNIEFAHIYSDQKGLSSEQIRSAKIASKIVADLKRKKKSYVLTLLVDEYHPDFHKLNFNQFLKSLDKLGVPPTYIGYESRMVASAKQLLNLLPEEFEKHEEFRPFIPIKKKIEFIEHKNKRILLKTIGEVIHFSRYSCALLSTAWYLLRFGVVQAKNAVELTGLTVPKPFPGLNIINILDKKYKEVEESNINIIKATKFKHLVKNIRSELY